MIIFISMHIYDIAITLAVKKKQRNMINMIRIHHKREFMWILVQIVCKI